MGGAAGSAAGGAAGSAVGGAAGGTAGRIPGSVAGRIAGWRAPDAAGVSASRRGCIEITLMGVMFAVEKMLLKEASGFLTGVYVFTGMATILTAPYPESPLLFLKRCRVDVSPTESSWMLRPLNKASLRYCAPDQCVPTLDCVTLGSHKAGSTGAIRLPIG